MLRRKRLGQSTAEYAIVIAIVIAAAIAMQTYVKRGIQAKVKAAVDHKIAGYGLGNAKDQYEPYYLTQDVTTGADSNIKTRTQTGGGVVRTTAQDETRKGGSITTENTSGAD